MQGIPPREATAIVNADGQAMLVAFEGWPNPLPARIEFRSTGSLVLVRDGAGTVLAVVQASAAPGLLTAFEVHLGTVADGGIVSLGTVPHGWR